MLRDSCHTSLLSDFNSTTLVDFLNLATLAIGVELFDPFPFVVCIIHGVSVVVKGYQDGGESLPLTVGDCIS